jgi:hypothetical protein
MTGKIKSLWGIYLDVLRPGDFCWSGKRKAELF